MEKDFDGWNEQKKQINHRKDIPLYRERDIRWCRLGTNVGFEQDGSGNERSRPVLVLKGFSRAVCLVVPLTTSEKKNPFHIALGEVANRRAAAIISQLRLVDTRRLDQKLAVLDKNTFAGVKKAIKEML